jgi:hypothetical protein
MSVRAKPTTSSCFARSGGPGAWWDGGATTRVRGGLSMPMPARKATMVHVRIMWGVPHASIRERPVCEIRISLPDRPSGGDQPQQISA